MRRIISLIALVFVTITGLSAQQMLEPVPLDPAIRTGVLDNGLRYFIMHNAKPENQAEFFIVHNVGAVQEEDTQQGLAHFLEHMAFNGTLNFPDKDLLNWVEGIGVKFGQNLNAFTSWDITGYTLSSVPLTRESIIDSSLLILHDWSHFISLVPEEIDNERGVIVEEKRTRNTASWRMQEKQLQNLLFDTKYAERNLIGYEDFLRTFDHQELRDFYYRWYRPDLQAVIVVGDFDVDMMEQKVIAFMSDIPAVENPEQKELYLVSDFEGTKVAIFTDPELTHTSAEVYYRTQPMPEEMANTMLAFTIDIYDNLAGMIMNERLSDISRKKDAPFLSANVGAGNLFKGSRIVSGSAYTKEGESLRGLEALLVEIEKASRFGFTQAEFERAQSKLLRSAQSQFDSRDDRRSGTLARRIMNAFTDNSYMPSPETEWMLDSVLINNVDLNSLNAYFSEQITEDNRFVFINSPEKEGLAIPTEEDVRAVLDRVAGMELQAPVDNTVKEPLIKDESVLKGSKVAKTSSDIHGSTIWTLKNGVKVVLKPTDHKADQILLSIKSGGGLSVLDEEDVVAANLLPSYISMAGVDRFNGNELQKQLAGKRVSMNMSINQYSNGAWGNSSVKDLETMFQLIYLYFTSPRSSEEDFDVMKTNMLSYLQNVHTNPQYVFAVELYKTLYDNNPRMNPLSYETVDAVRFEQMDRIFKKLYSNADDFTFTFVGTFDLETMKPLVEKYLGSLPQTKKSFDWVDDGVRMVSGRVESIAEMEMQAPKTSVAYVFNGDMEYNVKNDIALEALTSVLDMRYTTSIREEKGAAYGVGVMGDLDFRPINQYTMFVIFDTNPELVSEVLDLVVYDIEKIANEGVTAEELSKYKEFNLKEYADNLKDNSYWLANIVEYNVDGKDTQTGYYDALNALTSDDIKAMAARIMADGNVVKVLLNPIQADEEAAE